MLKIFRLKISSTSCFDSLWLYDDDCIGYSKHNNTYSQYKRLAYGGDGVVLLKDGGRLWSFNIFMIVDFITYYYSLSVVCRITKRMQWQMMMKLGQTLYTSSIPCIPSNAVSSEHKCNKLKTVLSSHRLHDADFLLLSFKILQPLIRKFFIYLRFFYIYLFNVSNWTHIKM